MSRAMRLSWLRRIGSCSVVSVLVLVAFATPASAAAPAQRTLTAGQVIGLQGTPHLWISDALGVLHWGGDTRALSGRQIDWENRLDLRVDELKFLPIGDPWLSLPLLKDGAPIYLPKWEANEPFPRLLH